MYGLGKGISKIIGIGCLLLGLQIGAFTQFSYRTVEVLYDSAKNYGNLQMVPVKFKDCECDRFFDRYLGLREAMRDKKVTVSELPARKGSHKGALVIKNRSGNHVVIYSGDMLKGGQQDRVLPNSTIIPPRKKQEISAFCIERNRWDDKPQPFVYGGTADWLIRQIMDQKRNQKAIWNEISNRYRAQGETRNVNGSLLNLGKPDSLKLDDYVHFFDSSFLPTDNEYAGFIFISGDAILSVELFAKAEYTAAVFASLVYTYAQTVGQKGSEPNVSHERQKAFMDKVLSQGKEQTELIRKQGVMHRDNGVLLHLVVYGNGF